MSTETPATTPAPTETPAPAPTPTPSTIAVPGAEGSPLGVKVEEARAEGPPPSSETPVETPAEPAVPTKYEFELPEGVSIDEKSMASFQGLLNEWKASPEKAKELMALHTAALAESAKAFNKGIEDNWSTTLTDWKTQINNDPEIGGDKSTQVQRVLGVALDEYGSPAARQAFEATGAGWNPAIVKFVWNMAKALAEGSPTALGRPAPRKPMTAGEALYGATPPQT